VTYRMTEADELILLTTDSLTLGINRQTGALVHLSRPGDASVIGRNAPSAALDARLNGRWLGGPTRYLSHSVEETDEGVALTVTVALGPLGPPSGSGDGLTMTDWFHLVGSLVERTIRVSLLAETTGELPSAHDEHGERVAQLDGVRLVVPGVAIGAVDGCRFEAPACAVRPRLPLIVAARQTLDQPGADPEFAPGARSRWFTAINDCPDVTPGLMIVHNPSRVPNSPGRPEDERGKASGGQSLLVWYVSKVEAATALVAGDGHLADFVHQCVLAARLAPGQAVAGGTQYILLHDGDYESALDAYRAGYARTGIIPPLYGELPGWVQGAAIYEVHPGQFGGFRGLAAHVPALAEVGINILYLMPVMEFDNRNGRPWDENWLGGGSPYAIKDFERLEPTLGTEADFQHLVASAHAHGMRVLLDLVPQGCALDARYVTEHPEWFCRDEAGDMVHSHGWIDTWSFDWANPDYHDYMLNWSLRLVRDWDVDGYRIDAPHGKEPNWDRDIPYHASATNLGVIELLERLQAGLKALKPDGVLLCELFGPIFTRSHDLTYDYYPAVMAYEMLDRRLTPREFGHWLADYWRVMPPGALRVCFTETHDTRDFHPPSYALRGSAAERALFGILVMAGFIPMIWSGQEKGLEDFYRGMVNARRQSEALRQGEFFFNAVGCHEAVVERDYQAHDWVFCLPRKHSDQVVWGLVSLWPEKTPFEFALPIGHLGLSSDTRYRLHDLVTGTDFDEYGRTEWTGADLARIVLTPEPFRPYLLELQPDI
jgi:starch synthase (maltosyl-transferring)